jgi:transposase
MTKKEAEAIYYQGKEAVVLKLLEYDMRLTKLEEMLGLNSKNSSKPSSTDDPFKKSPDEKNNKADKKSLNRGGQKGHQGKTLEQVENPDKIEHYSVCECGNCGFDLSNQEADSVIKRQCFDIPPVQMEVTEHQAEVKKCPHCKSRIVAPFPKDVVSPAYYGDNMKAYVVYLNTYHMLSYERVCEYFADMCNHPIGEGTIFNILNRYYQKLETTEEKTKEVILASEVVHSDETGINVKGKLNWFHTVSCSVATYYLLHQKRGKEAMDEMEILPKYDGTVVHDHWSPYNKYENCTHAFCNAHHLRELTHAIETTDANWAKEMKRFLQISHKIVKRAKQRGQMRLKEEQIKRLELKYENIIQSGHAFFPKIEKVPKKKGVTKKPKSQNLLLRLEKYKTETIRFITDFQVPFDNNMAERDLRMIKVKQKISGTFMSRTGGKIFARIKGYISTVKKNRCNVMDELKNVFRGEAFVPVLVG